MTPRQTRASSGRGIRRHGLGWQATASVAGQPRMFQAFPLETSFEDMQRWRAAARARMALRRATIGKSAAGTFAADVQRYLTAVTALSDYKGRVHAMGLWVARFGARGSVRDDR
jgi:hypothetical protein